MITTLFALICNAGIPPGGKRIIKSPTEVGALNAAQSPGVKIVEKLADGDYVVAIDGTEYRAITAEHARQIAEKETQLDLANKTRPLLDQKISELNTQVELYKKDAALSETQAALERSRADKAQAVFDGEHALRLQAEDLGKRSRVTKFFDSPLLQIGFKAAVPIVQMGFAARCR